MCCFKKIGTVLKLVSHGANGRLTDKLTIHAEVDAMNHLPYPKKRTKIITNIDILIIKATTTGELRNSAPCVHCLKSMYIMPRKLGYKINRVYYSNNNGEIECNKLIDLLRSDKLHVSSSHRKNSNFNIETWKKWRDSVV